MIACYCGMRSSLLRCAIAVLIGFLTTCAYSEQAYSLPVEAGEDALIGEKADTEQVVEEIWLECAPESSFSVDSVVSPQDDDGNWEPIDKSKAEQYGNTGFWYIGDSNMRYCFYVGGVRDSAHRVILDDKGVAIVGYTGLSSNVTVPSKIAGCDVVFVDLSDCSTSVGSLDVSSCSKLGLLECPSSPVSSLASLDVSSLPHLKYLSCENQELSFLDISRNRKLITLYCYNNYLSNQDALSRWLSAGGHYGRVKPQKARSYDSSLSATPSGPILATGLSNLSLPIPLTASDGTILPFVGGLATTLNLSSVPMKASVYPDGSFRIAFGTLVPPGEMKPDVWSDFKGYIKGGAGFSFSGSVGVLGTDNFAFNQSFFGDVINISGSLWGFAEGRIVDGTPVVTLSGVRMEVLRTLQFSRDLFTPSTPPVPITVMFDYGIGLNASLRLNYNAASGNLSLDGGNVGILFPYLCITGGVGNSRSVYVGAYGSLSNYFYIPASDSLWRNGYVSGTIGISVKALNFSNQWPMINGAYYWSYYMGRNQSSKEDISQTDDAEELLSDNFEFDQSLYNEPSEWLGGSIPAEAFDAGGSEEDVALASAAPQEVSSARVTLQENIFNNARPQLVVTESGKYVMVWVSAVAGRTVGNNTAVVYSVWDAASKTWSVPVILDDDGTADFDPSVAVRGENVLVTWSNATNSSFTSESSLSEVASSCGIKAVLLDAETGTVSNVGAFYDGQASMSSSAAFDDNGNAAVAWVTNNQADVLELSGTNTVHIAQLVGGQWTQGVYASVDAPVSEVALGQYGNSLHVAYVVNSSEDDSDDDFDGGRISSLYVGAIGASPVRLRGNAERIACLDFRKLGPSDVLAWQEGSDLRLSYASDSFSSMGEISGADFDFVRMGGSDYVVYSSSLGTDGDKTALYARSITADGLGDELSIPVKKDNAITGYSVAPYGQGIMVVMAATDAVVGANSIDETTALEMAIVNGAYDVAIKNAEVQPSCNIDGDIFAKVSFETENSGLLPSRVRAKIKVGDEVCFDGLVSEMVSSGEVASYDADIPVETSVSKDSVLSVELSPAGADGQKLVDIFADDNVTELSIGYSDPAIEVSKYTAGDIAFSVRNEGPVRERFHVVVSNLPSNETLYEGDTHSLFAGIGWHIVFSPEELAEKVRGAAVLKAEVTALDTEDCDLSNNVVSIQVDNSVRKLSGNDQFDTSAAIARATFPQGAATAVVACDESYCDAISLSGLAGTRNAPILLTSRTALPDATLSALNDLLPSGASVVLAGGTGIIDQAVEDSLTGAGFAVQRVFGNARDDTPVAAYRAGTGWGTTAVVAWAGGFSDMMSIAPLAYRDKAPLFLTDGDDRLLNADAVSCIASGGFSRVIFAGGTSVVPDAVRTQLEEAGWSGEIVRLCGNSAYDTNASIAQWLVENNGFSYDEFALATGESFVDGASGVAFCGVNASPLLLASDEDEDGMNCINSVLTQDACRSSVLRFNILGGTSVVSGETRSAALAALGWL